MIALPPAVIDHRDAHIAGQDDVAQFVDQMIYVGNDDDDPEGAPWMCHRSTVRQAFGRWLAGRGDVVPLADSDVRLRKLYDRLDQSRGGVRPGQPRLNGRQARGWYGCVVLGDRDEHGILIDVLR